MNQLFSSVFSGTRTVIQIAACSLIGTVMVFGAGLPLLLGGRFEGLIPLALGSCAFLTARKDWQRLSR
jgi:hypothetical protein